MVPASCSVISYPQLEMTITADHTDGTDKKRQTGTAGRRTISQNKRPTLAVPLRRREKKFRSNLSQSHRAHRENQVTHQTNRTTNIGQRRPRRRGWSAPCATLERMAHRPVAAAHWLGVQAAIDMRFMVHPLTWYGVVPLRNMRRDPSSKRQVRMRV